MWQQDVLSAASSFLQRVFIAASVLHSPSRSRKPLASDAHANTLHKLDWSDNVQIAQVSTFSCFMMLVWRRRAPFSVCVCVWVSFVLCNQILVCVFTLQWKSHLYISGPPSDNRALFNGKASAEAFCMSVCRYIYCNWFFSSSFQIEYIAINCPGKLYSFLPALDPYHDCDSTQSQNSKQSQMNSYTADSKLISRLNLWQDRFDSHDSLLGFRLSIGFHSTALDSPQLVVESRSKAWAELFRMKRA